MGTGVLAKISGGGSTQFAISPRGSNHFLPQRGAPFPLRGEDPGPPRPRPAPPPPPAMKV